MHARHADRMRRAVLLGNPDTKRTIYLERAAEKEGLSFFLIDWRNWREHLDRFSGKELFVKIDPPLWTSCSLDTLDSLTGDYIDTLWALDKMIQERGIEFFNAPATIIELLDKLVCKRRLLKAGISVTESLVDAYVSEKNGFTVEQLFEQMKKRRIYQVFIKPVNGSGAAGVSALRIQPHTGRMVFYTCALIHENGELVNTKRLRRFSEPEEILPLLEHLLRMDCIVERWYAKEEYQGYSYDLRAVFQEGELDFLLGRLSSGPVTNLHLNNHPVEYKELGLSEKKIDEIILLCQRCVECYPGLRSVGIDILLEKGSQVPRVIEMNSQGDLIYQDIYNKNKIYRHQAKIMKACCL